MRRNHIEINFKILDDLIYYIVNNKDHLCIFEAQKLKVFCITYDNNHYANFYRCYQKIFNILYIFRFLQKLCIYINYCFSNQINQIRQYQSYKELMLIFIIFYFLHIIIMNSIINLLKKYHYFLIVTNKFIRRLQFIVDYIIEFIAI